MDMETDRETLEGVAYKSDYEIYAPEETNAEMTFRFHEDVLWKILVVDDEEDVHAITKLSLGDFKYKNRKLNLIHAFSAAEARQHLNDHSDIAIILLDVVMENTEAGLELVKYIREELKNDFVRIVLRTGQPGIAPEVEVVSGYDINDYQTKADLTETRLYTVITSSLRSFESLITIDDYNKNLEKMVEERTLQIQRQSHEIIESIKYASRIQSAILPKEEDVNKILPDYFVIYKPKDIVSGDFYWIKQIGFKVIVAAVDCTGHGVPGALMSILGVSILNEIIQQNPVPSPGVILSEMRKRVKKSLGQTGKRDEPADGMDVALCIIDMVDSSIQYAGAFNPLYLVRINGDDKDKNTELLEYKADRMPVGIYLKEKPAFTNHNIKINKGDRIYIFSDGYVDQNGGPDDEKFKHHRFRNLLLSISGKTMYEQKQILQDTINDWMDGKYEQLDDILLIGVGF